MHTNTRTYILSSPCTYLAPSPPSSLNKQGSVDRVGNQNRCSNIPHKVTHTYIMVDMHAHTDTHSHTHSYTLVYHHTLPFNSGRSQFHPRSVLIIKEVSIGSGEKTKAFVSLSSTTTVLGLPLAKTFKPGANWRTFPTVIHTKQQTQKRKA